MTTLLIIALIIIVVFIVLFYHRDRLYMKEDLKDVVSEDMRKRLNMKTADAVAFENNLAKISRKKPLSQKIANEWDEITAP
ncbi:MAG: hypothetical protein ACD_62C00293G0006 [uncultured bacterium]|nr:MAG: hypothetical protein ACD_62C00293G0006 [uncultured bacterium]HLD44882.1 hypothetical protein [bacterium]